jgi:hypothetical protein
MSVVFTTDIVLVVNDVPVDNKKFLVTDFINLKIKPTQSFKCTHRDRVYGHRGDCAYV